MASLSNIAPLTPQQRASFGVARAKITAFDAVHKLWRRRREEGKSQADLARVLGKDEGWLSKNLKGPANWTIKTFGELVEALDGDLEIIVHAVEDPLPIRTNYDAYADYRPVNREGPIDSDTAHVFSSGPIKGPTGSKISAQVVFTPRGQ